MEESTTARARVRPRGPGYDRAGPGTTARGARNACHAYDIVSVRNVGLRGSELGVLVAQSDPVVRDDRSVWADLDGGGA